MTKAGRPKLPKNEVRKVFPLRLSRDERAKIEAAAKIAQEPPTQWARNQLLKAAGDDSRTT